MENRNVPLTWTNQISAQTSASKTLALISPPTPVSEMERSRVTLITIMCVLISSISGIIVEMRVKPGDNATIYCDCTYQSKFTLAWIIKPSDEHQPPLINLTEDTPHYSRVWNNSRKTFNLLVKNITESDLGLYYCALHEVKVTRKEYGERVREDVYHEGNRTTFLSFLGESVHSDILVLLIWMQQFLVQLHPRHPPPPKPPLLYQTVVSAGSCWSVCVLHVFSSPQSSPPPVCTVSTEAELKDHNVVSFPTITADGTAEQRGNMAMRNHNETFTLISRPAPVSEMEKSGVITLMCVWLFRISGEEVEMKVKPGANAVLPCDCNWKSEYSIVWFRNSSHEHMVIHKEAHPRYSILWSFFSTTSDLLVRNVSESDLGLYYCALQKTRSIRDKARACSGEDVCLYGNRTTRLSFHGKVGGDDVCYASLDLPGRGERRLKKKRVECSEFSTYSEDTTCSHWIHRLDNTTNTSVSDATLLLLYCGGSSNIWSPSEQLGFIHFIDKEKCSSAVMAFGCYGLRNMNSSHEHMVFLEGSHPRYSIMSNVFHQTTDLLVKNVSESDLGLYFCALQKKRSSGDGARTCSWEDVCYYGNRTTRLSFHDMTPQTPSTPPVSDCSVCWKLLVSVSPMCVLLSSVVSSTCVYWIYRSRTKGTHLTVEQRDDVGERERPRSRNRDKPQVGGDDVCYASLDLPSSGQKQLKKKRAESSDFCTYAKVKLDQS
ncbi:hypothetical protein NFI96_027012 [Prochilodus magdalenae]|nr:hypothetical protein NFI96_027012 [Prochilodus magdalenae]